MKTLFRHIAWISAGLLITLTSCTKDIPYKGPIVPPELVTNCFFQPDSLIDISLTLTQNIVSNDPTPMVSNASVLLLNMDSTLKEVLNYTGGGHYRTISTKPIPNKGYLLKIVYDNKTYWSTDSTPSPNPILLVDTSTTVFHGNNNFFKVQVSFSDDISEANYYKVFAWKYYREYTRDINGAVIDSTDKHDIVELESDDIVILEDDVSKYSKKELLFTDKLINGTSHTLTCGTFNLRSSNPNTRTLSLKIVLESISSASYLYTSTLNEHWFYQNDPFSQPVSVKGNISGGYGIFGGYTHSERTILLK